MDWIPDDLLRTIQRILLYSQPHPIEATRWPNSRTSKVQEFLTEISIQNPEHEPRKEEEEQQSIANRFSSYIKSILCCDSTRKPEDDHIIVSRLHSDTGFQLQLLYTRLRYHDVSLVSKRWKDIARGTIPNRTCEPLLDPLFYHNHFAIGKSVHNGYIHSVAYLLYLWKSRFEKRDKETPSDCITFHSNVGLYKYPENITDNVYIKEEVNEQDCDDRKLQAAWNEALHSACFHAKHLNVIRLLLLSQDAKHPQADPCPDDEEEEMSNLPSLHATGGNCEIHNSYPLNCCCIVAARFWWNSGPMLRMILENPIVKRKCYTKHLEITLERVSKFGYLESADILCAVLQDYVVESSDDDATLTKKRICIGQGALRNAIDRMIIEQNQSDVFIGTCKPIDMIKLLLVKYPKLMINPSYNENVYLKEACQFGLADLVQLLIEHPRMKISYKQLRNLWYPHTLKHLMKTIHQRWICKEMQEMKYAQYSDSNPTDDHVVISGQQTRS